MEHRIVALEESVLSFSNISKISGPPSYCDNETIVVKFVFMYVVFFELLVCPTKSGINVNQIIF